MNRINAREVMADANRLLTTFYALVAVVAVTGQTIGATHYLGWPWFVAVLPAALLELGGIALAVFADARRRLGERAVAARAGAVAVATFATWFNWISHEGITGVLFAGFTSFGFGLWLITSEARRRDALRAMDMLPPPAPAYPLAQWAAHPWLTWHARHLAKADPTLGVYGSLAAAKADLDRDRRNRKLAKALERKIRAERGRAQAALAVRVFDLDRIAEKMRATADYDGLAGLLAVDFTPAALVGQAEGSQAAASTEVAKPAAARPSRKRTPVKQPRRTPAETVALVERIKAEVPDASQAEVAQRIGITPRRLRAVLASPQPEGI